MHNYLYLFFIYIISPWIRKSRQIELEDGSIAYKYTIKPFVGSRFSDIKISNIIADFYILKSIESTNGSIAYL